MSGQTTPWEAGGITRDRFVTAGTESEGIFSLGDVNIFPASGPGPVAIAAGADIAAQIVKAVNNHEALLEFFKWAMRDGPWDGGDLDGGGIQDKAESLGLIVKTKYDIAKHGEEHSDFCEGDDFYEFAPGISDCVGQTRGSS